MTDLKIVVNNTESVLNRVLNDFKQSAPHVISVFHAIRNIESLTEGLNAVDELVRAGIVEETIVTAYNGQTLKYYRYRSENDLYRRMGGIHPISNIS